MNELRVFKNVLFFTACALVGFIFFEIIKVGAVDQIKSTDFFASSYESQISAATSTDFSIYIGDNLAGVSNPVKSAYFEISGVYTGNGTLEFKINNDSASSKVFILPNVGTTPTPFEIIYKDDSGIINPSSAGTYTYTLNVVPNGITISGLSAEMKLSHRYVPGSCPDGQPTNEKIKSTDFFASSYESQISSATSTDFSIYIGDNLAGVSNPIKSAYFEISGVYTGNGTLEFKINSDSASSKIFTLPNVGTTPTPFEIIYKDDSGIINPTSAGTYTYTLNVVPNGITISGLSAEMKLSHRYKPPTCGAGYPATGDLTSMVFDTGIEGAAYNSIMWKGNLGGPSQNQGRVKFRFATANNSVGPWNDSDFIGGSTCTSGDWFDSTTSSPNVPIELKCTSFNNKKYFRYIVRICSDDCSIGGSNTPTVNDVVVSWSP